MSENTENMELMLPEHATLQTLRSLLHEVEGKDGKKRLKFDVSSCNSKLFGKSEYKAICKASRAFVCAYIAEVREDGEAHIRPKALIPALAQMFNTLSHITGNTWRYYPVKNDVRYMVSRLNYHRINQEEGKETITTGEKSVLNAFYKLVWYKLNNEALPIVTANNSTSANILKDLKEMEEAEIASGKLLTA